MELIPETRREY